MLTVQQFLTQTVMTPMPRPPCPPDLTLSNCFLFSQMKTFLKRKHADVEEVKQKMAEALKGIKIDEFKTFLSSRKNISIDILHQMQSTSEVTEV